MIRKILIAVVAMVLAACATSEKQIRETLKKNPQILFDVIEENPEQFLETVNKAAKVAQQKHYEKQVEKMKAEQEQDLKNPKKPALPEDRRLSGTSASPITIVEYADFECPACAMAFQNMKKVKEKYGNKIQFYYKHMPLDFHKMAYPAAEYFEAVRKVAPEKALAFHDVLFKNQKNLNESFLKKSTQQLGIDSAKLTKALGTKEIKDLIEKDMQEFQDFGFTGTPVIIVNGVALQGAQPAEVIEEVISKTQSK